MAYALYYFKDKSVEVGKTSWMDIEDQQETTSKNITQCPGLEDEDGWINVKWDKGRKKKDGPAIFPAKVLMLSDNYSDLCKKREEFIKGEDIWKNTFKRKIRPNSRLMSDVEEEDERPIKQKKGKKATCTPKEAANHMIEDLKKELMAKQACLESTTEYEESSDEDPEPRNWSKAQLQLKELKKENKRLKQGNYKEILDAIQAPPVWRTRGVIGKVFLVPGSDVKVPKRRLNSLRTANPSVYIGDLAVLVYGRETLSSSSLTGRQSGAHKELESKPQLDTTKLDAIIGHALAKFPDISMQDVRRIIRKKCNNESYTKQANVKMVM